MPPTEPSNTTARPTDAPTLDPTAQLLNERGATYGVFMDHARIAMSLKHLIREPERQVKTAYLSGGGPELTTISSFSMLAPDQQHSLDVICDKIARILNGKPDYLDNWDDIAGYARLVADRLRKEQGEKM